MFVVIVIVVVVIYAIYLYVVAFEKTEIFIGIAKDAYRFSDTYAD